MSDDDIIEFDIQELIDTIIILNKRIERLGIALMSAGVPAAIVDLIARGNEDV